MSKIESMLFVGAPVFMGAAAILLFFIFGQYYDNFPIFDVFRGAALAGLYYWISSGYEDGKKWARILMIIISCLNIAFLVYLIGWEELPKGYSVVYIMLVIIYITVIGFLFMNRAQFSTWAWEPTQELEKLKNLFDKGLINQYDYESQKAKTLEKITGNKK